jgi:hypothetical protein
MNEAVQDLLNYLHRCKIAASPVLTTLLAAKARSDARDYRGKHQRLRSLIAQYPNDFVIDSEDGNILGITHTATGFRMHAPRNVIPVPLKRMPPPEIAA